MAGILGSIGGFSNPYGSPSQDEWAINSAKFTLLDGSGTSILFFAAKASEDPFGNKSALESVSDSGGRRIAIYEYPYRDGQATEDLGRKGERYSFVLTFFGPRYRERYVEFYQKVITQRSLGILTHPSIGDKPARLMDYEFVHRYDQFNAVSLRCSFVEDNTATTGDNQPTLDKVGAIDSLLRGALSTMTKVNRVVQNNIFAFEAILLLPGATVNAMRLRLSSIMDGHASLLGAMASTFSSNGSIIALASSSGGINNANSGTSASTGNVLPPVFEVGLPPSEAETVAANQAAFQNANQVTSTQLVYNANVERSKVAEAIAYHESNMGSDSADAVIAYRELVVSFQKAVESCIKSASLQTVQYLVPYEMTLAEAAFLNKLSPDRMVDIERLNPQIESANSIAAGSVIAVPSA
jgi:hypothetical protein